MKERNRLIIIEGPQGTGKTTLANYLRENIPGSNLYRLSGQKDKTETGKKLSEKMYFAMQEYMEQMQDVPMDLIFDRTFFTEQIYASLGYKDYRFDDVYESLLEALNSLNFDIYFVVLYLDNTEIYRERLARDSHHNYHTFSIDSSIDQQRAYLKLADYIEYNTGINVIYLRMDNFEEAYEQINEWFEIDKQVIRSRQKPE